MFTSNTLQVHLLDFKKANNQLTESYNLSNHTKRNYYFGAQHCGLIDVNNRFILVTPDGFYFTPQINDIKNPVVLFNLYFFEEIENILSLKPEGTASLTAEAIEQIKTGTSISLRDFMREHFNSGHEVYLRVKEILDYVNTPIAKNIYELQ